MMANLFAMRSFKTVHANIDVFLERDTYTDARYTRLVGRIPPRRWHGDVRGSAFA